jgi:hypothetical protein
VGSSVAVTGTRRIAVFVVALALVRGTLGAFLNAPGIGPDERGHLQYLQTFTANGWAGVQGVEARQPPIGYLPTLAAWWIAGGATDPQSQVFAPVTLTGPALAARLVSVAWSGVTAWATWHLARTIWPARPWAALLAVLLAAMAPGYLHVVASVTNEPAATALATVAILTAARTIEAPPEVRRVRLVTWAVGAAIALATKATNAPVVLATGVAIGWSLRAGWRPWLGYRPVRLAIWGGIAVAILGYGAILSRHPSSSYAATAARIWPEAVVVGSIAFVRDGAATEALRTFWHAWDYDVAWPRDLDAAITIPLAIGVGLAAIGAILGVLPTTATIAGAIRTRHTALWFPVVAQVAFAIVRYGIGSVAGAAMGGAAQAKTFFPAIAPASLLGAAGLVTVAAMAWRAVARTDLPQPPVTTGEGMGASILSQSSGQEDPSLVRVVTLGAITCLVATDIVGLAASVWRHARWVVPGTA